VEKLGVEVDEDLTKVASTAENAICTRCRSPLVDRDERNVPCCPICGTEPFEACQ
jgi:ribosomal protein L37AE/L43A